VPAVRVVRPAEQRAEAFGEGIGHRLGHARPEMIVWLIVSSTDDSPEGVIP
jgi:hypothetical protein